jgi:hypothetical protein
MEENVQTQLPTTRAVGIRYGLILSAISIAFFLIVVLSGLDMNGPLKWVSYAISLVVVFLAHKNFKDTGDGFMSYGQGIGIAFWMSLFSSVISSVFTYFYIKFIDSGFIDKIKEMQMEEMEKKGMSDAQMEQAMKFAAMFTTPEAILIFGIVFGIIGLIIGAIVISIFTQKKNPEPAI